MENKKAKILPTTKRNKGLGLIISLIIIQLLLLIYLCIKFTVSFNIFFIGSIVLSILTCIYILSSKKNSHSKAVWIIFILTFFFFAYILFWLSSERIFLLSKSRRYKAVYQNIEDFNLIDNKNKSISPLTKRHINFLYSTGKFKAYTNTHCAYYENGELFFESVLGLIEKATEFIFIEFYIIKDGALLDKFISLLTLKASQGVKVRIIYDDFGSKRSFSKISKLKLTNAGIELKAFNKFFPIISATLNYRDHRKIIVIDGNVGFTGGCNLADEYMNKGKLNGVWKDAGIKIKGEGVNALTLIFLRQWEVLSKIKEDYAPFLTKSKEINSNSIVIPFADGLEYTHPIAKGMYENLISSANKFLYIMSPYFILDDSTLNLLINKALSGVEIKIFLPQIPDKFFVYNLSKNNAEKLLDYGVKVYLVKNTFLHSKVILNEKFAIVGSINMDLRSFYQQFECAVFTDDIYLINSVKKDFNKTILNSKELTKEERLTKNPFYRVILSAMQLFAPLMWLVSFKGV